MVDVIDVQAVDSEKAQALKTVGWVSYILHLIVALVVDMVKKDEAAGTWQASHFSWRIRSVITAGLLYLVTAPLFLLLYLPGAIAWFVISIWFLYRIVRGMVAMNNSRPVGQ